MRRTCNADNRVRFFKGAPHQAQVAQSVERLSEEQAAEVQILSWAPIYSHSSTDRVLVFETKDEGAIPSGSTI